VIVTSYVRRGCPAGAGDATVATAIAAMAATSTRVRVFMVVLLTR